MHHLAADLCNAVPAGQWEYYQRLADAYNWVSDRYGHGFAKQNARTLGLLVNDAVSALPDPGQWTVPWHRMRDEQGMIRSWSEGVIFDPDHWENQMFVNEGGRLLRKGFGDPGFQAAPPPALRFEIERKVKDEAWMEAALPRWV